MIQHSREIESAKFGIGADQIETKQPMTRHGLLAYLQQRFRRGINSIHAKSLPCSHKAIGHRAHVNIVFRIFANAGLLIHPSLVNHIHHAADAVLGKEYRFAAFPQSSHHGFDFWGLWNPRIKMEVPNVNG